MISHELVQALLSARRGMTTEAWQQLASRLAAMNPKLDRDSLRQITASLPNQDAAWIFADALKGNTCSSCEIAAAMVAIEHTITSEISHLEMIWSGPPNGRFPVRRIDQMLYDLISAAQKRILLVTFAAHHIPRLSEHLAQAVGRGVTLTLIVESQRQSEGQLTKDAIKAFQDIPTARAHIYYWPLEKRERNQAGRPGKLHVKCAIIDDTALIGSANLTDDAFNRNMELGILTRDRTAVNAIAGHFQELICRRILVEALPEPEK